jgi:hypothetical protein
MPQNLSSSIFCNPENWRFNPFQNNLNLSEQLDLCLTDNESCKYIFPHDLNTLVKEQNLMLNLSCFHLNCQRLSPKTTILQAFFNSLSFNFDIISFTETWLSPDNANLFANIFPGYSFFHTSRTVREGGGVAAFIHNTLNAYSLDIPQYNTFEHLTLHITSSNTVDIILVVLYRPPNTPVNQFLLDFENFFEHIQKHVKSGTQLLLAGDYNIDLLHFNESSVNDFLCTIYSHAMYPCITLPTRITEHSATIIDNILLNKSHVLSGILTVNISDHLPIFTFSSLIKQKVLSHNTKIYKKHVNINKLRHDLQHINWPNFITKDVDSAYNYFLRELQIRIDVNTKIEIKTNTLKYKQPWITNGILNSCHTKNKLYKKMITGLIPKEMYTNYKNKLITIIRYRKKTYYNDFINNHKRDSRKIWQHINLLLGRNSNPVDPLSNVDVNKLNSFFANLGNNTVIHIKHSTNFARYLQGN